MTLTVDTYYKSIIFDYMHVNTRLMPPQKTAWINTFIYTLQPRRSRGAREQHSLLRFVIPDSPLTFAQQLGSETQELLGYGGAVTCTVQLLPLDNSAQIAKTSLPCSSGLWNWRTRWSQYRRSPQCCMNAVGQERDANVKFVVETAGDTPRCCRNVYAVTSFILIVCRKRKDRVVFYSTTSLNSKRNWFETNYSWEVKCSLCKGFLMAV